MTDRMSGEPELPPVDVPEEPAFQRRYGPWRVWTPCERRPYSWRSSRWLADVGTTPDAEGTWVFKRDPSVTAPLADVTWSDGNGIRYLDPEIILAYKAKLARPRTTPTWTSSGRWLDGRRRGWLRETVSRLCPEHPWLDRPA